jgi:hypothetical protein
MLKQILVAVQPGIVGHKVFLLPVMSEPGATGLHDDSRTVRPSLHRLK